jgi:cation:H+ antiporter
MISIAQFLGLSMLTIGFLVSSIGSDLPEIFNNLTSAYLGHGAISIGDSFGSVLTQITLVLGLIPFFCTFARVHTQT